MSPSNRVQPLPAGELRPSLSLLFAQAASLGLTLGLLIVASLALLLSVYGAHSLPLVYITVGLIGALIFYGFAAIQKRWRLIRLFTATELVVVVFLFLAWAGIVFAQVLWLAFATTVSFFLILQTGFFILGTQTRQLLDTRQINRYYPRLVAGFVLGFMIGGALVTPIQGGFGGTEALLFAAGISAFLMLILLLATYRRNRNIYNQVVSGPRVKARPLKQVLTNRIVVFIIVYQMLSTMASYLLDYMVMSAVGERLTGELLTRFLGNYTFYLNLTDLLFLLLVAGILLGKFGLRFGLTINPIVDTLLLIGITTVGFLYGPTSSNFFWLIIIARVIHISMTDGSTRASTNATYQALPDQDRYSVQTGIEGLGIPAALAATGFILLIFNNIGGLTLVHIALFTLIIALLWIVSAFLVFRDYAGNLLKTMRRRALDPVELTIQDQESLEVVEGFLNSDRLHDVRLALDVLEGSENPELSPSLIKLIDSNQIDIQVEALSRVERLKLIAALPRVEKMLGGDALPAIKGAAIRALCALQNVEAVNSVIPYLDSKHPEERLGACVGLLRYGGAPGHEVVSGRLQDWETSAEVEQRLFLAKVIGEAGMSQLKGPLLALLGDPVESIRVEALRSAGKVKQPDLLPIVIENLAARNTRSVAMETLAAHGELILPAVEKALLHDGFEPDENTLRLIRVCGQIKGEKVQALMIRHIQHPSTVIRDRVLSVLLSSNYQRTEKDLPTLNTALYQEANRVYRLLVSRLDVGADQAVEPLLRVLDDEVYQARRRIFLLLGLMYETKPIHSAATDMEVVGESKQALVMEMLNVTLTAEHKSIAIPLIEPRLELAERHQRLNKLFTGKHLKQSERLDEIIQNQGGLWYPPYLRACAIYAATNLNYVVLVPSIEATIFAADPTLRETAAWSLSSLAPEIFEAKAKNLLEDEDLNVRRFVATLGG